MSETKFAKHSNDMVQENNSFLCCRCGKQEVEKEGGLCSSCSLQIEKRKCAEKRKKINVNRFSFNVFPFSDESNSSEKEPKANDEISL